MHVAITRSQTRVVPVVEQPLLGEHGVVRLRLARLAAHRQELSVEGGHLERDVAQAQKRHRRTRVPRHSSANIGHGGLGRWAQHVRPCVSGSESVACSLSPSGAHELQSIAARPLQHVQLKCASS